MLIKLVIIIIKYLKFLQVLDFKFYTNNNVFIQLLLYCLILLFILKLFKRIKLLTLKYKL
ncbi:hypothetical protein H8356DRAFT_1650652 [Neocallimastix lanati (nom. inval.)]|nr:hypothetical protein H8356DRAFT_1650652 [Neocallimastix sp. JGI-2020a]